MIIDELAGTWLSHFAWLPIHVLSYATPKAGILSGRCSILVLFNFSYTPWRENYFQEMPPKGFPSQRNLLFLGLLLLNSKISLAQSNAVITQAPGFSSPSSCAQRVAKAVIDDSTSSVCPAGSPPSCFCGNEGLSKEWSDQISTDVLNNCLTSSQAQATSVASVFAAYCSAGEGAAATSTTTDEGSTSTTAAKDTTSTTAQGQVVRMTGASPTTSSQTSTSLLSTVTATASDTGTASSGGFNTSDKIAIGIGLPVGVATILGVLLQYKAKKKDKKNTLHPTYGSPPSMELQWMGGPPLRNYPTDFIPANRPSVSRTSVSGTSRDVSSFFIP